MDNLLFPGVPSCLAYLVVSASAQPLSLSPSRLELQNILYFSLCAFCFSMFLSCPIIPFLDFSLLLPCLFSFKVTRGKCPLPHFTLESFKLSLFNVESTLDISGLAFGEPQKMHHSSYTVDILIKLS
jgi:hypothetical protein